VFALALLFGGCAGDRSNGIAPAPGPSSGESATGTLTFYTSSARAASSVRGPMFVGQSTTHAYVFINGSLTPSNTSSSCTGTQTGGTGTFCTISWSTALSIPASYLFQVETDDGSTVLAEAAKTFALVTGTNTLGMLAMNGVAGKASGWTTTSCSVGVAGTTAGTCSGTVTIGDPDGDAISYAGSATVPVTGNSPTSGTVYDNGSVTLSASTASGLVTGTAQTSGSNVYSTFSSNTLTISGVNTTGTYTYAVKCAMATTTGSFVVSVGGVSSRTAGVNILDTQLANESPVATYPTASLNGSSPTYTCTNGVISHT
jgi:hypothetical protein